MELRFIKPTGATFSRFERVPAVPRTGERVSIPREEGAQTFLEEYSVLDVRHVFFADTIIEIFLEDN